MLGDSPILAVLPCVDLEGARDFYGRVLGLNEAQMPGSEEMSDEAAAFECGGGTQLLVYKRATRTKADHTAAGWMVEDIDEVADDLISRGVRFEIYDLPGVEYDERGVAMMGTHRSFWFTDPEGNILSVSQIA